MSFYDNDDEEQHEMELEQMQQDFSEVDSMIDGDMTLVENRVNALKYEIEGSSNPFLMMNLDTVALLNFVYTGEHPEPKRYVPRDGNNIYIPDPLDIEDVLNACSTSESEWVVCRTQQQQRDYEAQQQQWLEDNKERLESEQRKKDEEQKQKELEEKAKANKHNWTLPAELRGITQKKQEEPKVSRAQKRKNRRKAFQVNKENPALPSQKKGSFKVNRSKPTKM